MMRNITINIPEKYDAQIQRLKELGRVKSRSGAIRKAVKTYLKKDILFYEEITR